MGSIRVSNPLPYSLTLLHLPRWSGTCTRRASSGTSSKSMPGPRFPPQSRSSESSLKNELKESDGAPITHGSARRERHCRHHPQDTLGGYQGSVALFKHSWGGSGYCRSRRARSYSWRLFYCFRVTEVVSFRSSSFVPLRVILVWVLGVIGIMLLSSSSFIPLEVIRGVRSLRAPT